MSTALDLENKTCEKVAKALAVLLADTYVLYVKTQNFHWNVVDPRFHSLHKMFEEQYESLADAVDEIAERIRMLDRKTPAGLHQFLELSTLSDSDNNLSGDEMVRQLMQDHATIIQWLRPHIEGTADKHDEGTADLMIQRLRAHEKMHWMLKATL